MPPELEDLIPAESVLARSNTDPITRKTFCFLQLIRQSPPLRWGRPFSISPSHRGMVDDFWDVRMSAHTGSGTCKGKVMHDDLPASLMIAPRFILPHNPSRLRVMPHDVTQIFSPPWVFHRKSCTTTCSTSPEGEPLFLFVTSRNGLPSPAGAKRPDLSLPVCLSPPEKTFSAMPVLMRARLEPSSGHDRGDGADEDPLSFLPLQTTSGEKDLFIVEGHFKIGGVMPIRRSMTIIRRDGELALVNAVRTPLSLPMIFSISCGGVKHPDPTCR